jgi:hypothetical protein
MKIANITVVIFFYFLNASAQDNVVKSIDFTYSYPVSSFKDKDDVTKIYSLKDTISILFFKDCILYRLPEMTRFDNDEKVVNTEQYFIYNRTQTQGLFFKTVNDSIGELLPVDSFLRKRAMGGNKFEILADTFWRQVEIFQNKVNGDFIEKYVPIKKTDETCFDSIYYYFTNSLNQIDYSFSRGLDSSRNKKLYKVRLIFNKGFSISQKIMLPKREFCFEIEESTIPEFNKIKSIIDRFKRNSP